MGCSRAHVCLHGTSPVCELIHLFQRSTIPWNNICELIHYFSCCWGAAQFAWNLTRVWVDPSFFCRSAAPKVHGSGFSNILVLDVLVRTLERLIPRMSDGLVRASF